MCNIFFKHLKWNELKRVQLQSGIYGNTWMNCTCICIHSLCRHRRHSHRLNGTIHHPWLKLCWQSCQTFTSMTYTYACTFCVVNVSRHNVSVETSKEETPIQRRCDFRGRVDTFNYKSTYIYIYIYFQILLHLRFALFWKMKLKVITCSYCSTYLKPMSFIFHYIEVFQ